MKKITVLILMLLSVVCLGTISARASTVIEGPAVIYKAKNTVLPISEILDFYSSDVGTVAVSIDNYTGNGNVIGTYLVEIYATDGVTIRSKDVSIIVVNSLPGKVKAIGDQNTIYTNTSKALSLRYDILPALQTTGLLAVTNTTAAYILNDQYTDNYQTPGEYFYEFRLVDASGFENTYQINMIVKNSQALPDPDFVYTPPKPWTSHVFEWAINILTWAAILVIFVLLLKFLFRIKKVVTK